MNYDYGECSTCARQGDPCCVGCQPTMRSDGTYSRSLYAPHKEEIHFTTQIGGGMDMANDKNTASKAMADLCGDPKIAEEVQAKLNTSKIRDYVEYIYAIAHNKAQDARDGKEVNVLDVLTRIEFFAKGALESPMRNCDRDLSDRNAIFAEFRQWVHASSLGCVSEPSASDAFRWLLAPANKKGKPMEANDMTLDEAIAHCNEVAGSCDTACRREHKQLADWLQELKDRRRYQGGDVAAMREAVALALSLLDLKEGVPSKAVSQKDIDFMKAALAKSQMPYEGGAS